MLDFESAWAAARATKSDAAAPPGAHAPALPQAPRAARRAPASAPAPAPAPLPLRRGPSGDDDPLLALYGSYLRQGSATFSVALVQQMVADCEEPEPGGATAAGAASSGAAPPGGLLRGDSLLAFAAAAGFAAGGPGGGGAGGGAPAGAILAARVGVDHFEFVAGGGGGAPEGPRRYALRRSSASFDLAAAVMRLPSGDFECGDAGGCGGDADTARLPPPQAPAPAPPRAPADPQMRQPPPSQPPSFDPAAAWAARQGQPVAPPSAATSGGLMPPPAPVAPALPAAWQQLRRRSSAAAGHAAMSHAAMFGGGGGSGGGGGGAPFLSPLSTRLSSLGSADSALEAFAAAGGGGGGGWPQAGPAAALQHYMMQQPHQFMPPHLQHHQQPALTQQWHPWMPQDPPPHLAGGAFSAAPPGAAPWLGRLPQASAAMHQFLGGAAPRQQGDGAALESRGSLAQTSRAAGRGKPRRRAAGSSDDDWTEGASSDGGGNSSDDEEGTAASGGSCSGGGGGGRRRPAKRVLRSSGASSSGAAAPRQAAAGSRQKRPAASGGERAAKAPKRAARGAVAVATSGSSAAAGAAGGGAAAAAAEGHSQVYLGGFEVEESAAEAYDMAALKTKGLDVKTNFDKSRYGDLLSVLHTVTIEELVMAVRRQSQGFSRGSSTYRGVTAHPSGRWEARIGIPGSRHIYLGLYSEERDAARAYDTALVRLKGLASATNYSLADYAYNLGEHNHVTKARAPAAITRLINTGDALGALLRPQDARPEFEAWIKGGLAAVGAAPSPDALERAARDTTAAARGPAAAAAGGGAAIAAAAVARVAARGGAAGQQA
ncbi:MAG: hypothetical protein J3K34DRAFT_514276 [Monoraphidium minutum]|nr:MAG: hypothetical protein J3K34DRAFT_514276 [Monoraphidium minutum]